MKSTFVVVLQMFYQPGAKPMVIDLMEQSLPVFAKQRGFIGVQTLVCDADTHSVSIIEWESKAASDACMQSPDFNRFNPLWQELISSGGVRLNYMFYNSMKRLPDNNEKNKFNHE